MKALSIGSHTLVVPDDERPATYGNCFDVEGEDGQYHRVANFVYENIEALEKLGLTWPIEIEALGTRTVVIMDGRIGERWYSQRYCEVCTPGDLLPITQRQRQLRDIARGIRTESENSVMIDVQKKAEFP
jgi:hypothetical protein